MRVVVNFNKIGKMGGERAVAVIYHKVLEIGRNGGRKGDVVSYLKWP